MKRYFLQYFILLFALSSCATANKTFDKREYRKSKNLATYSGMENELQDGCLILKENGYFKFNEKFWLVVSIKQAGYVGRYAQNNDTLYLNWLDTDPKQLKYYLSKKCIIDPITKNLWFIDDINNERLWELRLQRALKQ